MLKVKSTFFKQKLNSPSPDKKAANKVQPTNSPTHEIQRYLVQKKGNHQSTIKVKRTQNSNIINPQQNQSSKRIQQLEQRNQELQKQLASCREYLQAYEQLAARNKKLEQQMGMILEELERRTRQEQANLLNRDELDDLEMKNQEKLEEIYQYVADLEETIKGLSDRNRQIQQQIRKNSNQNINALQQRLMSYIFNLEQKLSDATFRNHEIMKNIETFRQEKNNHGEETLRQAYLQNSDPKPESLVSMMNLEISSEVQNTPTLEYSSRKRYGDSDESPSPKIQGEGETVKKDTSKNQNLDQDGASFGLCQKCKKSLRGENFYNPEEIYFNAQEDSSKTPAEDEHRKLEMKPRNMSELAEKVSILQSQINVIVDTSQDESAERQSQQQDIISEHSSTGQHYLILQRIKNQLISVMQTLQQLVHQCDCDPTPGTLVAQLKQQQKLQEIQIAQLQQQLGRMKLQVQMTKRDKQKIQKFWKAQIRQQQDQHRGRITCVDPSITKSKIDRILHSIRSFESQYREYSSK